MESLERLIKTFEMTVPKKTVSLDSRPKILPMLLQWYRRIKKWPIVLDQISHRT